MEWQEIKSKIYYQDGSWRDIYILNTTKYDWQIWADFVNLNYRTSFYIAETDATENQVNIDKVFDYWNGDTDYLSTAAVFINKIRINAHFFTDEEIENDINPSEIDSMDDHNEIIDYMRKLSNLLHKKVILTAENLLDCIYISTHEDKVIINLD